MKKLKLRTVFTLEQLPYRWTQRRWEQERCGLLACCTTLYGWTENDVRVPMCVVCTHIMVPVFSKGDCTTSTSTYCLLCSLGFRRRQSSRSSQHASRQAGDRGAFRKKIF